MFVTGLVAGGVLSAGVLGLLSGLSTPLPAAVRQVAVVAVAVLGLLRELGAVSIRLPQNTRQVPQDVLARNLVRGAAQFGFELGTGVRTYVSASAPYVVAVAILLAGQRWPAAVLAGLGFAAGRAATPLLRLASGDAPEWDRRLRTRLRVVTVAGAVAITAAFAVLFA